MTTTEKNIVIAEFMGLFNNIISTNNVHSWSDAPFFYNTQDNKEKLINSIAKYSKYHSDWNWLMQVVEKIETHGFTFDIKKNWSCITRKGEKIIIRWEEDNNKIEAVYNACLQFIQWYNQNKI